MNLRKKYYKRLLLKISNSRTRRFVHVLIRQGYPKTKQSVLNSLQPHTNDRAAKRIWNTLAEEALKDQKRLNLELAKSIRDGESSSPVITDAPCASGIGSTKWTDIAIKVCFYSRNT